jgi:hypothetical protein
MASSHPCEEDVTAAEAAAAAAGGVAFKRRQAWKMRQDTEKRHTDLHLAAEAAFITSQAGAYTRPLLSTT